jgi:hypothetical protein
MYVKNYKCFVEFGNNVNTKTIKEKLIMFLKNKNIMYK